MMSKMIIVFLCTFLSMSLDMNVQSTTHDYNKVSEDLLNALKNGTKTDSYTQILENTTLADLESFLDSDDKRLAFWMNVYNSYIILILQDNPELYENRQKFFNTDRINIAGKKVSFAKIEHGVIRRSQWALGLGLISKPFPAKWERKLRVKKRDYRIHFALNCGAIACPPVTVYDPINLEDQLEFMADRYIRANSEYNSEENKVTTTPLFSWFRGDFGNKKGVKRLLNERGVTPSSKVDLAFKAYDWTLDINNFVETPFSR